MSRPDLLSEDEIATCLAEHPAWTRIEGSLHRTFSFANFREAFAFMTHVALIAEKFDHHPDWSNVYGTVHIALTTHDAGGLTSLDRSFAASVDAVAQVSAQDL